MKNQAKDRIIAEIEEAIIKEEMAIPIYVTHLRTALFWAGVSPAKRKKITAELQILKVQSQGHIKLLKEVKKIHLKNIH